MTQFVNDEPIGFINAGTSEGVRKSWEVRQRKVKDLAPGDEVVNELGQSRKVTSRPQPTRAPGYYRVETDSGEPVNMHGDNTVGVKHYPPDAEGHGTGMVGKGSDWTQNIKGSKAPKPKSAPQHDASKGKTPREKETDADYQKFLDRQKKNPGKYQV